MGMKVQAAKSAFEKAGGNLIPTGPVAPATYAASAPISQGPPAIVSHANGAITPADTPAVQAAKASHSMKVQAAKFAFQQSRVNLIPNGPVASVAYGGIVSGLFGVSNPCLLEVWWLTPIGLLSLLNPLM